jgi:hypothetical protein
MAKLIYVITAQSYGYISRRVDSGSMEEFVGEVDGSFFAFFAFFEGF